MGRYDLTDFEWCVIEPLMPMDRRGPKPQNNRQIINGMFYILRTGSPWRDLPDHFGTWNSVYQQFRRWSVSGLWDTMLEALNATGAVQSSVQMIDSTIVRAHQHAAGAKGGLKTRILGARAVASRPKST